MAALSGGRDGGSTGCIMTPRMIIAFMAIVPLLSPARADEGTGPFYEAVAIVTGQRDETRVPGIRRCFIDVLQKVSGDQSLAQDRRVDALADDAASFVTSIHYQDRLWKRPIHDEQGTRDRPYDLTVGFDHAKLDAALRALGREPWTADRPRVAPFVAVRQGTLTYLVSTDGPHGYGQADAFTDAAARVGVPVVVPSLTALAAADLSYDGVEGADPASLESASSSLGATVPLVGSMVFSDAEFGWVVDWRFAWHGVVHRWQVKGVNFDAAFLDGMRGVAQIASNHGSP